MSTKRWLVTLSLLALAACGGRKVGSVAPPPSDSNNPNDPSVGGGQLVAHITNPNGDVSILSSATLTLRADFLLGSLTVAPATVSWTSSLDGALGTTNPLRNVSLSQGQHTITVTGSFDGKTAVDTVTVNVSNIAVRIVNPDDGTRRTLGNNITFDGRAAVDEGGGTITVLVSGAPAAGNERTATFSWTSSLDGALGTNATFQIASLSEGTHTITLTVTDDQAGGTGASGSASIQLTILPPNTRPTVAITDPASCPVTVEQGQTLAFAGTVTDPDAADAGLTGSWLDSISGTTTDGNSYTFPADAALGKHQVTFSATDSQGATDRATCTVYVVPPGGSLADLFPAVTAINSNLPANNNNVLFIGTDGNGNTLIGNEAGAAIYDSDLAVIQTPNAADYYDGVALGVSGGNVPVTFITTNGSYALVGTNSGVALCDYASGQLSNCDQVNPAEANAALISGDLATAGVVVAGTDNGLFVAGYAGGDPVAGQSMTFTEGNSNLPQSQVNDVLLLGDTLYVATDGGLCLVTDPIAAIASPDTLCSQVLDSDNSLLRSDRIKSLAADGNILWIGTSEGLVRYDTTTGAMVVYTERNGLIANNVNDVVVDADGIVWVATNDGVSRFDPATGAFTNLRGADWGTPGDNRVNAIFIDAAGNKWFATENSGVVLYTGA